LSTTRCWQSSNLRHAYSKLWKEAIHRILKKLRNKFDQKWLRILMSCNHFPNMREMLQEYLSKKPAKGIKLIDFKVRDCNCRGGRGPGKCQCRGFCRMPVVIYRITCRMTNKIYIGLHWKLTTTRQDANERLLPGRQKTNGERSPL
jgi:hypothetical protein